MKINIDIMKTYKGWKNHKSINKCLMVKIIRAMLNKFDNLKKVENYELSLLLTDNMRMLDLNSKFRGKSKATNVLSFPDINLDWRYLLEFIPNSSYMYLGDVAFGYEIMKDEAIYYNKTFEHHFIHLFTHSLLHLIGFDHKNDEEARVMENLEIEILSDFAVVSPY